MVVDSYRHQIAELKAKNRELKEENDRLKKNREPEKGKYMDREAKVSEER